MLCNTYTYYIIIWLCCIKYTYNRSISIRLLLNIICIRYVGRSKLAKLIYYCL